MPLSICYNRVIGNYLSARAGQGFVFTLETGGRLRQLRGQAGLTLEEAAYVMGHPPGFASHLSRLERGKVPTPSLGLVAAFLRACRASFADLLPVLGAYTGRPPVRETRLRERVLAELASLGGKEAYRLLKYDLKRGEQLRPEVRVRAASRQARAAAQRKLLDAMMEREVNRLGVKPSSSVRLVAFDYARMVWRALSRTERHRKADSGYGKPGVGDEEENRRSKRGRPRKTRDQRLREARSRILELAPRILPAGALDLIRDRVVELFEDLHRSGEGQAG
jgi:transcriptional regulator with XRE-family HTH domain